MPGGGTLGGAGASGLSDLITLAFATTGTDGTIPGQSSHDQPTIEAELKARMKESQGWNAANDAGFAGLPSGLPMVAGIIAKLAEQITGLDISGWIDMWTGGSDSIGNLGGVIGDALGQIFTLNANWQSMFKDIDFLDGGFDTDTALETFINAGLLPFNLIASLVGGFIPGGEIPGLDASKIISGIFGTGLIPGLDVSKIISGVFGGSFIPSLDASKITTGIFGTGLIPGLDVSKIISGIFGSGFIPSLDASKVTTGTFGTGLIPNITKAMSTDLQGTIDNIYQAIFGGSSTGNTVASVKTGLTAIPGGNIASAILASIVPSLDASKITTGSFGTGLIPSLAASKITSGTFATGLIPNITKAMSTDLQGTIDAIYQAINGGSSTGNTVASVKTGLLAIPGGNIGSAILAAIVPSLDASKITTGSFGTGLIPDLDAAKVTTGIFTTGLIPNLAASKITSGTFGTARIPSLDVSQITTGTFTAGFIPTLDASKIVSGTFTTGLIPSLSTSKITSGTFTDSFIPGIGSILDTMWKATTKGSTTGNDYTTLSDAVNEQTDTIAALSAAISDLTATEQAASNSGVQAIETFEYTNTSTLDSSLWNLEWLEGTVSDVYLAVVDGHNAGMVCPSGNLGVSTTAQEFAQFKGTNKDTLTDYQDIEVVIAQQMEASFPGYPSCAIDCYGAMNTGRTQWVRARWQPDGRVSIRYKNGGSVSSEMAYSTGNGNPSVGGRLKLRCGTSSGIRYYQALINGSIRATWNDSGALTARGSSNRQGGWGMQWESTHPPGKITQWTMADNAPVTVTGVGLEVYRAATGTVSVSNGDQSIPNSFFDSVQSQSNDITWSASTSTATIVTPGWYAVSFALTSSATLGVGGSWCSLLWKNGSAFRYGPGFIAIGGSTSSDQHLFYSGNHYLVAGDTLRAGSWRSGLTHSFFGDANGKNSWFNVTKTG